MNLKEKLRNGVIYNAALYAIMVFAIGIAFFIVKYHRVIYGGGVITFTVNDVDLYSLWYGGAFVLFIVLKAIEYCMEHNDDTMDYIEDANDNISAIAKRVGDLEQINYMGKDLQSRIERREAQKP